MMVWIRIYNFDFICKMSIMHCLVAKRKNPVKFRKTANFKASVHQVNILWFWSYFTKSVFYEGITKLGLWSKTFPTFIFKDHPRLIIVPHLAISLKLLHSKSWKVPHPRPSSSWNPFLFIIWNLLSLLKSLLNFSVFRTPLPIPGCFFFFFHSSPLSYFSISLHPFFCNGVLILFNACCFCVFPFFKN